MSVTEITFPGNLAQVLSIIALRSLPSTNFKDGQLYAVGQIGGIYTWDASSLAADDSLSVVKPNDITPIQAGRWLLGQYQLFSDLFDQKADEAEVLALKTLLAGIGGASFIGTQNGTLQGILSAFQTKAPNKPYNAPESGLTQTLQGLSFHFYDPMAQAVRPTFGGGANLSGKVIPYTNTTDIAALWQRHSFTNVYFNQWLATKDDSYARRLSSDWSTAYALYPSPGMFTGGTGLYKGTGPSGSIVRTFDDACWLALYHMQADIVGASGVSGQPAPIAYMVDTITAMLAKFVSPATSSNPLVTLIDHAPNLTNIDYGLGSFTDAQTGKSRFTAPPVQTGTFGSLYARTDDTDNYPAYGKCSSAFEAHMAIAALYAFEKLGYFFMLQYAKRTQEFIRANLLTPDPAATPNDPAHTPSTPAARKAQYLVETEFCIDASAPSNDPYPVSMRPRFQWYGKPRANLDSTYLGGAFAFCVLSARLYRLTGLDSYRVDALNTAKAIISTQAYGRLVSGKTIIANTRDPHSEGHFAYLFATEVLSLPDAPHPVIQALVDSGSYIANNCPTSDGYLTGDWAGPESDGTYDTWEARYANNGTFAGAVQIMTSSETLAMLQAAVAVSDWAASGLPAPLSAGYDASQALVTTQGRSRQLISIGADHGYCADFDIFQARARGQDEWAALIKAVNTQPTRVTVTPAVGGIAINSQQTVTRANPSLVFMGGREQIPLVMQNSFVGQSALRFGAPGVPIGSPLLENAWFVEPQSLGYSGGALAVRRINNEAFVEVWGGQAVLLKDCGGYGMPHLVKLIGCGGANIRNLFAFGGVWNPLRTDAQQSISHVYLADGSAFGLSHNVNVTIDSPEMYGGNTLGVQPRTIGANTVQARLHCGPRYGVLVESAECVTINSGFAAGYAEAAVVTKPSNVNCVLLRVLLNGVCLDESNDAIIKTFRDSESYPLLDTLIVDGCSIEGQILATNGIRFEKTPLGFASVRRVLRTNSLIKATLGSAAVIDGADDYHEVNSNAYGYNLANNDDPRYSSGVYNGGTGVALVFKSQFGGGQNALEETNTVDANGLTPNGCKWGVYAANVGTTQQAFTTTRNLAKAGGGRFNTNVSNIAI